MTHIINTEKLLAFARERGAAFARFQAIGPEHGELIRQRVYGLIHGLEAAGENDLAHLVGKAWLEGTRGTNKGE